MLPKARLSSTWPQLQLGVPLRLDRVRVEALENRLYVWVVLSILSVNPPANFLNECLKVAEEFVVVHNRALVGAVVFNLQSASCRVRGTVWFAVHDYLTLRRVLVHKTATEHTVNAFL